MILYITALTVLAETVVCQFFVSDGQLAIEPHFSTIEASTTTTTTTTGIPTPPRLVCEDKLSQCDTYRSACQATGPNLKWAMQYCAKTCNLCNGISLPTMAPHKGCFDANIDCESYGKSACINYLEWSQEHCNAYCGFCFPCADKLDNCGQYGKNVCTNYHDWAHENCKSFCGYCDGVCAYKGKQYYPGQSWQDGCSLNCTCLETGDGQYNCTKSCPAKMALPVNCYYQSSGDCCPVAYCRIQDKNGSATVRYNASLFCEDKLSNCASYPESCAPQYRDWASKYCARFCSLC